MPIFGNKGEWSEFYAFLKILSDKVLFSADENLQLISNSFIKILGVLREEKHKKLFYEINRENNSIVIKRESRVIDNIPIIKITSKLANILDKINLGSENKGTFEVLDANLLMGELHCKSIKSASSRKSDISLKIEDPITGTRPIRSFSIKSKIGRPSTLLNASQCTNIRYKIIKKDDSARIKTRLKRLDDILGPDNDLVFDSIINENFKNNLTMIDSCMPEIIGEIVKAYYLGLSPNLNNLTNFIEKLDPLNYGKAYKFYSYKVKQLLRAVAFGMQPSKRWHGEYEIHGGYIIVKKNGELACFHLYDRDNLGKFLFQNTKLETPSVSRHKYGTLYKIDGNRYVDLNLQIRFRN